MRSENSTTKLLAAVVAGSAVRRALSGRTAARPRPGEPAHVARLRRDLLSEDPQVASEAARGLLAALEPVSLAQAHAMAFDGPGPVCARAALREAWASSDRAEPAERARR